MITLELGPRSAQFHEDGQARSPQLALGPQALRAHWRQPLPNGGELEAAIETVEDLVMPLHGQRPHGTTLQVAATSTLPGLAFPADIEAVEALFTRAAAIAMGRPATSDPELADGEVIAVLLVLREVMHHLGFTRLERAPG